MAIFIHILGHNIVPIFTIIGLGFMLSKKFDFNIYTLSKLIFYLFTPAFVFVNLYTSNLELDMLMVLLFSAIYLIINDLLGRFVGKVRKFDMGLTNAFKNSILFNNSGNIGLSLVTLVFSSAPFVVGGERTDSCISIYIFLWFYRHISASYANWTFSANCGKYCFDRC